jgi:poly(3-hydroxybutyrate) depolymerase/chitodextrinase
MKKHYMLAAALRVGTLLLLFLLPLGATLAQNCPPSNTMPEFEAFTYTPIQSWNTSAYLSYQYHKPSDAVASDYMRFRMLAPNGFDRCASDNKKYPLIIFLHGSGESGVYDATPNNGVGEQDNDKHLVHGGQKHLTAVTNGTFPGFVIFPQIRKTNIGQNYWGIGNLEAVRYIIDKLIADYKVDPDRVYIHGLSMGGEGSWIFLSNYPKYFAAGHPMSAAGSNFWNGADGFRANYKHIPLRQAQGGLDTNPTPSQGNDQVQAIRAVGGNIRYSYYPNGGHAVWVNEYDKTDFFSWFLGYRKNTIWVQNGQTSFCPGENFSVMLGFTAGFDEYQWTKNDTTGTSFASTNEITVTQAVSAGSGVGTYYGRFRRGAVWTNWSAPVIIDSNKAPSATPTITANGSVNLPPLDGSPEVILSGPSGKSLYTWAVVPSATLPATQNITVSTAGSYTLQAKDAPGTGLGSDGVTPTEYRATPQGCLSAASSPIVVTTSNGTGVPAPPANFFASINSPTSIILSWDDRSANELGFEIYRTTTPGSGYKLITTRPASSSANPQTYVDNSGVLANTTYYYRMRTVNSSGGSTYTPEISISTSVDNAAPTAPALTLVYTLRTEISLSWASASDNVGIYEYDIYQNGALIATVPSTTAAYKATGLVAFSTYNYTVKARDLTGNTSPSSNQITAAAINSGLLYSYYHHTSLTSTSQIVSNSSFVKSGVVGNFSLSPREREDNYAFTYDGYITIPTTGTYTFYLSADAGAQLYVNNVLVVNHDGVHTCYEKTGTPITLSAGSYAIKVLMFENVDAQCLTVKWQGPGISKNTIPDASLRDSSTPPAAVTAPSGFLANTPPPTYNTINLKWNDNSNNETGFEIYRSLTTASGTYVVVNVTGANATSWSDTGLNPATNYFYKIRAINATNASTLVGPALGTTAASPGVPSVPTNLVATATSATSINLTWNDNSSNEGGFEIQKSSQESTGFVTLTTTAANVTSFLDTQVNGHSTVYYKVRARNTAPNGTHSAYTTPASSATTPNRAPVITDIANRSVLTGSTSSFSVQVTDADTDPISFTFLTDGSPGLPAFASFDSDGYGTGTITLTNAAAGTYAIEVQASDGIATVTDNFQLVVGTNNSPVLPAIANQTTEEGRVNVAFQIAAATDADAGQTLTYTTSTLPSFVTFNASNRTFTYNPTINPATAGIYSITVTVKDNASPVNGVDSKTFSLTVLPLDNSYAISVNFVSNIASANFESSPWNNTGSPSAADITNLKDESGNNVRFVTLNTSTTWSDFSPMTVALTGDPNTLYTKKVRESYFFRSGGGASIITLKNLNPALQYKLTIYGAGPASGGTAAAASTKYLATGTTGSPSYTAASSTVTLVNGNNSTNTAVTGLLYPTAAGNLTLAVSRGDGLSTGYYYINAMIITAQYPSPTAPDAPSGLTLSAPAYNTVELSWTDNSFNETSFEILRSSTLNGTYSVVAGGSIAANETTFTDNSVTGRTTYYYKVRAVNSFGSASTNALVITTPNGAPVVANPGTITVRVGQTVQHAISATDPEGDAITFSTQNLPPFATLVDNGNGTGFIRVIPTQNDIGSYPFTLRATDNLSAQSEVDGAIIVLDAEADEAVFINFNNSVESFTSPWNNKNVNSSAAALTNSSGTLSSMQITKSNWTGSDNGGVNTGSNAGIYPDNVISSFWTTSGTGTITFSGLDDAKRYNLTLFGSRNEFWFANTIYTITSGTPNNNPKTLNTTKNISNTVRFVGIQPSSGVITISVQKAANLNASPLVANRDACINAMAIESYTPGTTPRKPTTLVAEGVSKTAIKLVWHDNSSDETGFEISRAANQGGTFSFLANVAANVETYTDLTVPQNTAYLYRVRALGSTNNSGYTNEAMATSFNQVILVNLNYSAAGGHQQAPAPWNNTAQVPVAGMVFSNLKNELNANTTVDLSIVSQGSGAGNETGFVTGNNSGVYPDAVLANYYYYEQFEAPDEYLLSQLDPNYTYDLVFLGNEWTAAVINGVKAATDYIVGTTTVSQFSGRNTTETVSIKGVTLEQNNTISLGIKCNDEARYGICNAIEIRSYTPLSATFDTEPPSVPQGLVASGVTDTGFQVAWNPSSDNIGVASYEVFLGSELAATISSPDTVAVLTTLQPSTTYSVSVRAVDIKGNRSSFSNALQVTTLPSSTTATVYYPQAGDITLTATWNTQADGSGSNPINFTLDNQHFLLTRDAAVDAAWTISGTNSKLMVDTLFDLTVNNTLAAIVDVLHNASVIINTTASPTFGTLAPTSTVSFNATTSTIPGANYGNLMLEGTSSTKVFGSGNYFVNGDLEIANGVTLNGATGNTSILTVAGDLTLAGSIGSTPDNQLLTFYFNSGAAQSIITAQSDIRFHHIRVSDNTQLTVNGGTTPKDVTLGTANGGGLLVEEGSVFNLGHNTLIIQGTGALNPLNETGQLSISKGEIAINSSGTQLSNLYFVPTADTVRTLRLNANQSSNVNIRSTMYVYDLIDLVSGTLNANDNIVLVSDATQTARIGRIGNSGSFNGRVEFQRYMEPRGRVYRYLGAPVYSTSVANWIASSFQISGPFTGSSYTNSVHSLYYYDDDNGGWIPYPSSTSQELIEVGRGYSIFIFETVNPQKLRITGPIQQGNFTFTNLAADQISGPDEAQEPGNGWNLIANPYASPIQWGATGWSSSGLNGTVYVRSNDASGGTTVSSVKVWDGSVGSLPKGIITQGQSFWVKAAGSTTPTLTITEDAKYDTVRSALQRVAMPRNFMKLMLSKGSLKDETFIRFSAQGTDGVDTDIDAFKLTNSYFNLSSVAGGTNFAINHLPEVFCEKRITLNVQNAAAGQYAFSFHELNSFDYEIEARLIDHFNNQETTVEEGSVYSFQVTSNPASSGSSRFELVIAKPSIDESIILSTEASGICGNGSMPIRLSSTQRGARYQIIRDNTVLKEVTGTGNAMTFSMGTDVLNTGNNVFGIRSTFEGCSDTVTLATTATLEYVAKPSISIDNDVLVSSSAEGNQWLLEGNPITGATGTTYAPEASGEYTVKVSGNTCETSSDPVLFAITGTEQGDDEALTLYPNPVKTRFIVKLASSVRPGEVVVIQLYNAQGMIVGNYSNVYKKEGIELSAANLNSGLYTIRIEAGKKQFEKRFIRE